MSLFLTLNMEFISLLRQDFKKTRENIKKIPPNSWNKFNIQRQITENPLFNIFSADFIHKVKGIFSQAIIFTLWKPQKCDFNSVQITSDCDVASCIAWSAYHHLIETCSKTKEDVITRKFNVSDVIHVIYFTRKINFYIFISASIFQAPLVK